MLTLGILYFTNLGFVIIIYIFPSTGKYFKPNYDISANQAYSKNAFCFAKKTEWCSKAKIKGKLILARSLQDF